MTQNSKPVVPFGAWPSPITAESLVKGSASVGEIRADGSDIWWSEQRPQEGGRTVLVRRSNGAQRHELFDEYDPQGRSRNWNARTALLEYGGGAWAVNGGTVVFADWADQRLYRVDPTSEQNQTPQPITPEPPTPRSLRYSEISWLDSAPGWLLCVRESHAPEGEPVEEIVAVPLDGRAVDDPSMVKVLVTGPDFVHQPVSSADKVAWISWDHPRMPWDGTELMSGTLVVDSDGTPSHLDDQVLVAGGPEESIVQPGFLSDGSLCFCTDRTGWWNPWRQSPDGEVVSMVTGGGIDVEIGGPLWVGGSRWWCELSNGRLLASARSNGSDALVVVEANGDVNELGSPFSEIGQVVGSSDGKGALVVAGSALSEMSPLLVDVMDDGEAILAGIEVLRPAAADQQEPGHPDKTWISEPKHITFESQNIRIAHGLFYPPLNPEVRGPDDELPPLIVMIHGGPTSAARHMLSWAKQFWTSRGFAVVDVDYGGSTGYGRPYRRLLEGNWGIVDVEDAVAAATYLSEDGRVDGKRLAIRGGSAGGFTTLAALCFHDAFSAGASLYGVADLNALAADTHKFESRYLDSLVGPWPEDKTLYDQRSPINHTDGFNAPLIVLQGSEDEVVPPNQAEMIVAALADKGVAHAYLLFEGEQHGFRQAPNIVRALEAELWFYSRVFGFESADEIEPVEGAVGL